MTASVTTEILTILAETTVRSTVAALVTLALVRVLRIHASHVRHRVWTAVALGMLAMPVLALIVTPVSIPLSLPITSSAPVATAGSRSAGSGTESSGSSTREPDVAASTLVTGIPPEPARHDVRRTPSDRLPGWPGWLVMTYGLGVLVLIIRLIAGVLGARRILHTSSTPAGTGTDGDLVMSAAVSVPMIVGVWRPRIVVPAAWGKWPEDHRTAVVAHERAHIARRDPLVLGLAYLNCCVFWFHPLSWWLRRQLSITAEQACDEAAVRATGNPQRFVEILVALASTVRRHRGRVRWPRIAITSGGLLGKRIDRVLAGVPPPPSILSTSILWSGMVIVIGIVAACRQSPPPLAEDPQIAAEIAEQREVQEKRQARQAAVTAMDAAQVATLEARLDASPEDLEVRELLMEFYRQRGAQVVSRDAATEAFRHHVLWMTEHHPERESARSFTLSARDPGYDALRRLWQQHIAAPDVSARVTYNAVSFFQRADSDEAERLLLHVMAVDPDGPQPRLANGVVYQPWISLLGQLYTDAIAEAHPMPPGTPGPEILAKGEIARRKLETTNDATLLITVGRTLTRLPGRPPIVAEIGRAYLARASQLEPTLTVREARTFTDQNSPWERMRQRLKALRDRQTALAPDLAPRLRRAETLNAGERAILLNATDRALAEFTEEERGSLLPRLAAETYAMGEYWDATRHDAAAAALEWAHSRRYAEEGIVLARKYESRPEFVGALWSLTLTLGVHALRDGHRADALRHLRAAADMPAYPEYGDPMEVRLLTYLLAAGERQSVIEYLEHSSARQPEAAAQKSRDIAAIRAGTMPAFYQRRMSR
jgi:beta-lactamase regulating signal transducer with metallopeptidase domain